MEEKIVGKEVKMQPDKTAKGEKLSYDQLNQVCAEMSQQLGNYQNQMKQMYRQMQQMEFALQTKRMDYLFKVVETANTTPSVWQFSSDFVSACCREIEESLTIREDKEKADKEN